MTLEQLRIFLGVAEDLNMTRAAARLHLTQPAVSAAIAALEERYAVRLFDRIGRRIELTEAGRAFLPAARDVIGKAGDARRILDDLEGLDRGEVRIAASQTVATYWLPPRMARFATRTPGVRLHLTVGNTAEAIAALLDGRADIGFVEGAVDAAALSQQVVGGDEIALYAAPGHPLLGRPLVPADLAAAHWVMREPGSGTRDHLMTQLARHGLSLAPLRIALELPSNGAVLEAIEGSDLIGGISALAAAARVQAGLVRQLDWPSPSRAFTMLLHRERHRSRATAALIDGL